MFFTVIIWFQKQVAELLIGMGAVGSASEVYEQLGMWEDVIACYQRMGKSEKVSNV